MMSFQTQFTVQVLSGRIENLTIRGPKQSSFVAGSVTNSYLVRALDQNGNPASGHSVLFGVGKATLKAKIGNSGFARLVVRMPHQAGDYQLMVSDETGRVKASSSVRVHETAVGGVRWLGDPAGLRVKAGATLRQAFPYQVVDKYGNALPKVSMSLDVYNSARSTSLVAIQGESKAKGAGQFSVSAPNKEGRYWVYISPTDWSDKGAWVTFDVTASDADTVQIVTGDNQTVRAGSHAPRDFMLMLSDQFGNPVIGQDVNWVYQVKKGSESRFLNKVSKTNVQGIAVFNVVMDREPGVRELKAYVTRHGRKYKQSFYYKIVSNEVGAIEIISGRDQIAHPGHPLPQPIRVRLVNRVGSPIGDAVVAFVIQPTTAKSQTLLQELSVHTNQLGIASAFLVSPSFPGKYHIKIAPAKNPQISGVALLTVL
jgi:hypothetical protein